MGSDGVITQKQIIRTLFSAFRVATYAVLHAAMERQVHEDRQWEEALQDRV